MRAPLLVTLSAALALSGCSRRAQQARELCDKLERGELKLSSMVDLSLGVAHVDLAAAADEAGPEEPSLLCAAALTSVLGVYDQTLPAELARTRAAEPEGVVRPEAFGGIACRVGQASNWVPVRYHVFVPREGGAFRLSAVVLLDEDHRGPDQRERTLRDAESAVAKLVQERCPPPGEAPVPMDPAAVKAGKRGKGRAKLVQQGWDVQFAAATTREEADSWVAKIEAAGFKAVVRETDVKGKGHFFRVRIGPFATREEAERFRVGPAAMKGLLGISMKAE